MTLTHRLAIVTMLAGAPAFAQSGTGSAGPSGRSPGGSSPSSMSATAPAATMTPTGVLSMLQQVDQDEIRLAQLAQNQASSNKVKDYAKDMIDDHGALDKKLSDFARDNKLTLSESQIPSAKRQQLKSMVQDAEKRLQAANGAQFDREYMQSMSSSHAAVLADLDAALPGLKGQDKVYDLVKTARGKVEDHQKHAADVLRDLNRAENATGGTGR